jgi:hypothetical protein
MLLRQQLARFGVGINVNVFGAIAMRLLASAVLLLCVAVTPCSAQNDPTLAAKLAAAFGPADAAKVSASADALLRRPVSATNALQDALDCLGAAALAPLMGAPATARVAADADALVALSDPAHAGNAGWSLPMDDTVKACDGPGSAITFETICNPAGTIYMFETGLALTCLGKAHGLTHKAEYLAAAQKAVDATWTAGGATPGCPNCFTYWYSLNPAAPGHYVRNTNVLMGMGLAALYADTHDARYAERLGQIANAERAEMDARNFGYYGIADPRQRRDPAYERRRIENHVPYVAKGLYEVGTALGDPIAADEAAKLMNAWMTCQGGDCGRYTCAQWGADSNRCMVTQTAAPCFFTTRGAPFKAACQAYLDKATKLNGYQIWAVVGGVE